MANREQGSITSTASTQQQIKRRLVGFYRRHVRDVYQDSIVRAVALARRGLGMSYTLHIADARRLTLQYDEATVKPIRRDVMQAMFGTSEATLAALEADFDKVMAYLDEDAKKGANMPHDIITLYTLVRLLQPGRCIETGVLRGVSSVAFLQAFEEVGQGFLHSIDVRPAGDLVPEALRPRWQLHIQDDPDNPLLPKILQEGDTLDFFFHDSNHTRDHMLWEYEQAWPHLRGGGILGSHDVVHTSAFDEFYAQHQADIAGRYVVGNIGFLVKR